MDCRQQDFRVGMVSHLVNRGIQGVRPPTDFAEEFPSPPPAKSGVALQAQLGVRLS